MGQVVLGRGIVGSGQCRARVVLGWVMLGHGGVGSV